MFCPKCGATLDPIDVFCRKCGQSLQPRVPLMQNPKSIGASAGGKAVGILMICLIVIGFTVWAMLSPKENGKPDSDSSAQSANTASRTENPTNDALLAMSRARQALMLGQLAADGCIGTDAFYQGMGKDLTAFWDVRCSNGISEALSIQADKDGHTQVLDCSVLSAVAHVECFQRLNQ